MRAGWPDKPGVEVARVVEVAGDGAVLEREDLLAPEAPLEIRLALPAAGGLQVRPVAVTMRTPGRDRELACGFLYTEQVVRDPGSIEWVGHLDDPRVHWAHRSHVVQVRLRPGASLDLGRLERHFYTASSCGVCGKAALEAVAATGVCAPQGAIVWSADWLRGLPARLKAHQQMFGWTGGIHAAALVGASGEFVDVAEDVGRHNAVDKLVGRAVLEGRLPLSDTMLLLSGRAAFELVQKALVAGVPGVAAVGAPTSLAVELAQAYDMTLVGFLSESRFNIYSGAHRIGLDRRDGKRLSAPAGGGPEPAAQR